MHSGVALVVGTLCIFLHSGGYGEVDIFTMEAKVWGDKARYIVVVIPATV